MILKNEEETMPRGGIDRAKGGIDMHLLPQ